MTPGVAGDPLGVVGAGPDRDDDLPAAARALLERWVDALLATPGLTALKDRAAAWSQHVQDSLAAVPLVARFQGSIVDVGSGGGAPGIPLAAVFPEREVMLLEANGRKCDFLRRATGELPNVSVVHGRAEEQPVDAWGVAVAKALAPPPVATEWCLPLVRPGGAAILYVAATVSPASASAAARRLAGEEAEKVAAGAGRALLLIRKLGPTPPGFPRRSGVARKRPLA